MDLTFPPALVDFRAEVRAFLYTAFTPAMRDLAANTSGVFSEPPAVLDWQRALDDRGWLVPHWPSDVGGLGWTPLHRFIFDQEVARAGAPTLPGMGLKLVGPVIYTFGTAEQKARWLPPPLQSPRPPLPRRRPAATAGTHQHPQAQLQGSARCHGAVCCCSWQRCGAAQASGGAPAPQVLVAC